MNRNIETINKKFDRKLVGNAKMRRLVCETLLYFPRKTVDFITKNVWFVSSFEDSWGFVLRGDELVKGKFLVFLGDELFEQESSAQHYTIAHEIGHVVLGHRNSIIEKQSKAEVDSQEREAHQFALKYIHNKN